MDPVILKRADLVKITGLSYFTINNLEKAGKFPARRKITMGRVGWIYSEVKAWAEGLAVAKDEYPNGMAKTSKLNQTKQRGMSSTT